MVGGAVTGKRTIAGVRAGGYKFEAAIGGRRGDIIAIEINEPRLGLNAVRIVTGRAGGFLVHDVKAMAAVLPLCVGSVEALVVENTAAVVAFVAEGIFGGIFDVAIGQYKLPLEQGDIRGAVRTVGARATGIGSLIVVVAIGAIDAAGGGPGRQQAWNIRVFADRFDRMK